MHLRSLFYQNVTGKQNLIFIRDSLVCIRVLIVTVFLKFICTKHYCLITFNLDYSSEIIDGLYIYYNNISQ